MQFDKHRFIGTNDNDNRQYGLLDKETGVKIWCPYPEGVTKLTLDDVVEQMNHGTGPVAAMHQKLSGSLNALIEDRLQA